MIIQQLVYYPITAVDLIRHYAYQFIKLHVITYCISTFIEHLLAFLDVMHFLISPSIITLPNIGFHTVVKFLTVIIGYCMVDLPENMIIDMLI